MTGLHHRNLGFLGFLGGLVIEGAALLPFLAPEVTWVSSEYSLLLHVVAVFPGGGGVALLFSGGHGFRQWGGPALLLALIAGLIPGIGLFASLFLALIIVSHHAQRPAEKLDLVEVPSGRDAGFGHRSVHGPGPLPMPLVSVLQQLDPTELREIVLGLESLPPCQTRPILQRLQKHSDVRVQLYANGLLNDQLDDIERRLSTLRERIAKNWNDEASHIAIIETYTYLFHNNLVAADEVAHLAGLALREAEAVLTMNPSQTIALEARIEFLMLLGQFRENAYAIEALRPLPGQQQKAARFHAQLQFEVAAAQPVPISTQFGSLEAPQRRRNRN